MDRRGRHGLAKHEHYLRFCEELVDAAARFKPQYLHFPTATGTAGWKTDRGRIYILYGPPDEIDDHSTGDTKAAVPFIDWTYRYLDGVGANVTMDFVDTAGTSDFRMTRDPHPPTQ